MDGMEKFLELKFVFTGEGQSHCYLHHKDYRNLLKGDESTLVEKVFNQVREIFDPRYTYLHITVNDQRYKRNIKYELTQDFLGVTM